MPKSSQGKVNFREEAKKTRKEWITQFGADHSYHLEVNKAYFFELDDDGNSYKIIYPHHAHMPWYFDDQTKSYQRIEFGRDYTFVALSKIFCEELGPAQSGDQQYMFSAILSDGTIRLIKFRNIFWFNRFLKEV